MRMNMARLALMFGLWTPFGVFAADHQIKMVDEGAEGNMIFEPGFLNAKVGDTVTFVVKDPGHNVISRVVPSGADGWKGTVSQGFTITLAKEGIYLYECDLHKMLGMVGVIQVGAPVNLETAKAAASVLSKKMAMGAERLDEYMGKIR